MPVDPAWSSEDLARELCDVMLEKGQLKAKPAFIRTDREAKLADMFKKANLNGEIMVSFDNPGPLEMMIRKETQGEPWVEHVVSGLIGMLPDDVASKEKRMDMDEDAKEELAQAQSKSQELARRRQEDKGKGKGRRGADDEECYNCGGYGHIARDCPDPPRRGGKGGVRDRGGKGRDDDDMECYNCGGRGHMSRDCNEPRKPKGGGKDRGGKGSRDDRDMECYNCGGMGHMSRDCPEPSRKGGKGKGRRDDRDRDDRFDD